MTDDRHGPARSRRYDAVGPVLEPGDAALAVIAAIRRCNAEVDVEDHGSYLRVRVPGRCVVTREAIEECLGRGFRLPGDLEAVMPSFKGRLALSQDDAVWSLGRRA